jgi:hypothetical protein
MDPRDHARFTAELAASLAADPRVVALVGLGSTAATSRQPDPFSDHDLFVVVRSGHQERYRATPDWLPDSQRIVLWLRETAHGCKALYDDGHIVELAVFDPGELALARVNAYRVVFDRGDVAARLAAVAERTRQEAASDGPSDALLCGQLMTLLLTGVGRHRRGEILAGGEMVRSAALRHLLVLCARHLPTATPAALDNLDPWRRFESAHPGLGEELALALRRPTPEAARVLLDVAERELTSRLGNAFPRTAAATVRRQLGAGPQP